MLPRFSVLNSPPDALATYQTFGFRGSMSMSETRPVVMSGPVVRSGIPLSISAVMRGGDCAPMDAAAAATARLNTKVRFMAAYSVTGWSIFWAVLTLAVVAMLAAPMAAQALDAGEVLVRIET